MFSPPFERQSLVLPSFCRGPGCLGTTVQCLLDLALLGDGLVPSADSCFIKNLQFNGGGKAFKLTREKNLRSEHPCYPPTGCSTWVEKLKGAYFSAEAFYA